MMASLHTGHELLMNGTGLLEPTPSAAGEFAVSVARRSM
jgi:hypothetical protein